MAVQRMARGVAVAFVASLMWLMEIAPETGPGVALAPKAHALIGAPLTPMSYAGVARRTTRRVVVAETATVSAAAASTQAATAQQQQAVAQQQAATAQQQAAVAQQQAATAAQQQAAAGPAIGTIVSSLPADCVGSAKGGVEYYKCGNVYYRAAFQGNSLVYVVQQP